MDKLAEITGLEKNIISLYENNKRNYTLNTCNKIAEALEITPEMIYDEYLNFVTSGLSERIVKYRNENNLNKKQLAEMLDVSPCTVASWELKESLPPRSFADKLKKSLEN